MEEQTFVMIKPEHVDLYEKILSELDVYGERVRCARTTVSEEIIKEHYKAHAEKVYFEHMVDRFKDKEVAIAVYEGEDVVEKIREGILPIRERYATDLLDAAIAEGRSWINVIHASDSRGEAQREMELWKELIGNPMWFAGAIYFRAGEDVVR